MGGDVNVGMGWGDSDRMGRGFNDVLDRRVDDRIGREVNDRMRSDGYDRVEWGVNDRMATDVNDRMGRGNNDIMRSVVKDKMGREVNDRIDFTNDKAVKNIGDDDLCKAIVMTMYEHIFGKRVEADGSLNGDDIKKLREEVEKRRQDREKMREAFKTDDETVRDEESVTEFENDTDEELNVKRNENFSIFTKKNQLVKGSNRIKSYREMANDTTDSSLEISPEKPNLKCFNKVSKDEFRKQTGAIFDVHHKILKAKRGGVIRVDKENTLTDPNEVDENELDNVLNVRLDELLLMKRKERLNYQKSDSSTEQNNTLLKEKNSDDAQQSINLNKRLKKMLTSRKLAESCSDPNFGDGVVKKIRIREREITFRDVSDKNKPNVSKAAKERTYAITETEYMYSNSEDAASKSLADDFDVKCSIREFEKDLSKANFTPNSSILSKKLIFYNKSCRDQT